MSFINFRYANKILILWTLFFIQLFLIGALWMLQGVSNNNNTTTQNGIIGEDYSIHFIRTEVVKSSYFETKKNDDKIHITPISNFSSDFIYLTKSGEVPENGICFREGSHQSEAEDNRPRHEEATSCQCKNEWHGKDCGQPEILWRAFMTSRVSLAPVPTVARREPRKVFYMITGNIISIEMLEIQVMELRDIVDFYMICNKKSTNNLITKRLKLNFAKDFHKRFMIFDNGNCTAKLIYNITKDRLDRNSINSNDIFIISEDDEILNRKAIKYLKYYDNFSGLIRFRLKYNVYGFFMQHPEGTRIGSAGCTINYLEENYKSDPAMLLKATRKPSIIIGDLNHFGGWHCEYCFQPSEIIETLNSTSIDGIFPNTNKNKQIDVTYIQNLIASGLYVDGKLGLIKLHRYSDKYFSPEYVESNNWRFDNILINLYISFDDDYEN